MARRRRGARERAAPVEAPVITPHLRPVEATPAPRDGRCGVGPQAAVAPGMTLVRKALAFSIAVLALPVVVIGCDPEATADKVDAKIDCASICNRYKDCFDNAYDTETCRDRCETSSKNDSSYDAKAESCDNCLDQHSCAGSAFSCATECANIVP